MTDLYPIPCGYGTVFVELLHGDGTTASGIELHHNVKLPKVYGRVAAVGETHEGLRVDDMIVMLPNAEQEIDWSGEGFSVVHESAIRAVINKPDGSPYFSDFDAQ